MVARKPPFLIEIAGKKTGQLVTVGLKNGHVIQGILHDITFNALILKDEKNLVSMFNAQGKRIGSFSSFTLQLTQIYGISVLEQININQGERMLFLQLNQHKRILFLQLNQQIGKFLTLFLNNGNIITGVLEIVSGELLKINEVKIILGVRTIPVKSFYLMPNVISNVSIGLKQ